MAILTDTDGQDFRVAGHYALVLAREGGARREVLSYRRLDDLAQALALRHRTRNWWSATAPTKWAEVAGAVSPNGKLLDLNETVTYGRRLLDEARKRRLYPGHVHRRGPVHGVRCWRGGGSYFRRIGGTAERRLAGLVVFEDGEVAPRAKRNFANLPDSWNDYSRARERNWKSQHKGRKAWDRRPRHGEGEGA